MATRQRPLADIDGLLEAALAEDLGRAGDITSRATIPEDASTVAHLVVRAPGCIAGLGPALRTFELVDRAVATGALVTDGTVVHADTVLASVAGPARAILAAERVALNLLGHLSGIATATRDLVDRVAGTGAQILDTRKTTPLLRALEKEAVRAGGGRNHRMGLYDAVLIKDNHVRAVGSVGESVRRARARVGPRVHVEVEIDRIADLDAAIAAGADIVLLDNMRPAQMRRAVERAAGRCLLEASGGITKANVRKVAETGVDFISVGWITHSAPALDVALDFDR
jgi:nicotinate-nucleotide pyrophosphorylase (carboxylating)